jgi:hypothetical protein
MKSLKEKGLFTVILSCCFLFLCAGGCLSHREDLSYFEKNPDLEKAVVKILGFGNYSDNKEGVVCDPCAISEKLLEQSLSSNGLVKFPFFTLSGSGMYISKDGLIVTNTHVVEQNEAILVKGPADKEFVPAKVLYKDTRFDLAFIYTGEKTKYYFPISNLNKAYEPTKGSNLFVLGYPLEFLAEKPSITRGTFSRKLINTEYSYNGTIYQTDASMFPGNSGGPVFDEKGNLAGIAYASAANDNGAAYSTYALVIPASEVLERIGNIKEKSKPDNQYKEFSMSFVGLYEKKPEFLMTPVLREKCEKTSNADICMALSVNLWNKHVRLEKHILKINQELESKKDEKGFLSRMYSSKQKINHFRTKSLKAKHYALNYFKKSMALGYEKNSVFTSMMRILTLNPENRSTKVQEIFGSMNRFNDTEKIQIKCSKGDIDSCNELVKIFLSSELNTESSEYLAELAYELAYWLANIDKITIENIVLCFESMIKESDYTHNSALHSHMNYYIQLVSRIEEESNTKIPEKYYLKLLKEGPSAFSISDLSDDLPFKNRLIGHLQLLRIQDPSDNYTKYITQKKGKKDMREGVNNLIKEISLLAERYKYLKNYEALDTIVNDLKDVLAMLEEL